MNLIRRLELLLIAMGIFSLPTRTMVVSRSSRQRVRFSTSWGPKALGRDNWAHRTASPLISTGNIYVADASNHRVQKLSADGNLIAEWRGPGAGFYGPRRIAIGPDDSVYVMDQGRTRVVKFSPDGQVLTVWGSKGTGDGQFDDPASVAVDPTANKVYVADPRNKRIQVFDSDGKFLTKWISTRMGRPVWLRRPGDRFEQRSIIRIERQHERSARFLI